MSGQDLVVVRTFPDHFAADVAKSALDAAGIECFIRGDDAGGMRPHLGFANGIDLVVRVEDREQAETVLGEDATER